MERDMKVIVVDDEKMSLALLQEQLASISYVEVVGAFQKSSEALSYATTHDVDVAILDVQIDRLDGIELGSILHNVCPDMLLIYATGFDQYALQAYSLHALAYLLKPYNLAELRYAMETAHMLFSMRRGKRIFARTFGHFDLYVDGEPIMFKSGRAKEMLAILVDRKGGTVSTEQMIALLWEDRPNDEKSQNLCYKIGKTLEKELEEAGASKILINSRGVRRVDTEQFECDVYQMLDGDKQRAQEFAGEYMTEYSWAEERMALLEKYLWNSI